MSTEPSATADRTSSLLINVLWSVGAIALLAVVTTYIVAARDVETVAKIGPWGDFVGGTLNPILTCLSFIALLFTIALQQRELQLARREFKASAEALEGQNEALARQTFEATLFQLLQLLRSVAKEISFTDDSGNVAIDYFLHNVRRVYDNRSDLSDEYARSVFSFEALWSGHATGFVGFVNYVTTVLSFVAESRFNEANYRRVIRALLGERELIFLYYYALRPESHEFRELASRMYLFANVRDGSLFLPEHAGLMPAA